MHIWQLRGVANLVNLATPLGLLVARAGRATVHRGPRDLRVATGYRLGFPVARAFTVGSVVISRHSADWLEARPDLMRHEESHASQWACCAGLPFLPLYVAAMAYSWLRAGDRASANSFERRAGLADGGYR